MATYNVIGTGVYPLRVGTTGGELRHVILWQPPLPSDGAEFEDPRGLLSRINYVRVNIQTKIGKPVHYMIYAGRQKKGIAYIDSDGVMSAEGSQKNFEIDRNRYKEQTLDLVGAKYVVGSGKTSRVAELVRIAEIQVEGDREEISDSDTVMCLRMEVGYTAIGGSQIDSGYFYHIVEKGVKPMGDYERLSSSGDLALTHLPDEGYAMVGYEYRTEVSAGQSLELYWGRLNNGVAPFRWRAYEDGDTRLCIPQLVAAKFTAAGDGGGTNTAFGNLEFAFNYEVGVWSLSQPGGEFGIYPWAGADRNRFYVSSRVPCILYDTRRPSESKQPVDLEAVGGSLITPGY